MPDGKKAKRKSALQRYLALPLTLMIFLGSAATILAGVTIISSRGADNAELFASKMPVGVTQIAFDESYTVTRRFTGVVEAASQANLGFELAGRVTEVLVEEGEVVGAGTVLARLDTAALIPEREALKAELAALQAEVDLAKLTLSRANVGTKQGFSSIAAQDTAQFSLAKAQAGVQAIRARIAGVDVRLEKSVLTAPFDARIGARLADPGQTVDAGQMVLVLFDAAPLRLRVGLPPNLVAFLNAADTLPVDTGNGMTAAKFLQIRPDLDPTTRSQSVVFTLPADAPSILGDTAELVIEQTIHQKGFWAPLSALREGVRGSWSVMALEETPDGDRTRPAAVEVIHSDGARVFLQGALPPGARIIAEAPDRVAPGQLVQAQLYPDRGE